MVSNMSSISVRSAGVSNDVTGSATRNKRGSPIFRISCTAMAWVCLLESSYLNDTKTLGLPGRPS